MRVAVDGVTGAGKTSFASELAAALQARGRAAVTLSMDGFHHPRAHRYRQGRESAAGYYEDAYDLEAFGERVLVPVGPGGHRRYRTRILDLEHDQPVDESADLAPDAVLVVDGTFLQRPELAALWDEVVFLDTSFAVARERAAGRDAAAFGGVEAARRALDDRYHAACRRYLESWDPASTASVLIGNDDLAAPELRRIGGRAGAVVPLFSYGTLQQEEVQRGSFGRSLDGTPDVLPGFATSWVTITDPAVLALSGTAVHPVVARSDDEAAQVAGTLLRLTAEELAAADLYEVDDYRRVLVRLASGTQAWVYLQAAG